MFGGGNQRLQTAPFGIGEITVVRSAAFHLDSVTGKSARAHLFKRALGFAVVFVVGATRPALFLSYPSGRPLPSLAR